MKITTIRDNAQKIVLLMAVLITLTVMFTGCGSSNNFEEYLKNDKAAAKAFESTNATYESQGMKIDVEKNTVIYTFKYETTYSKEEIDMMKESMETALKSYDSTFEGVVKTLEEESGIKGIKVKLVYKNGDGAEIFSKEY